MEEIAAFGTKPGKNKLYDDHGQLRHKKRSKKQKIDNVDTESSRKEIEELKRRNEELQNRLDALEGCKTK